MSNAASLESKIAAIRPEDVPVPAYKSRKFAFRPAIGVSGHDGFNGEIVFAFADPRDELAANAIDRRKKSVQKHLNKQSRLNARRALHAQRDVTPTKADTHCAGDLASIDRYNRAEVENFPKRGTEERERLRTIRKEPFHATVRRAIERDAEARKFRPRASQLAI